MGDIQCANVTIVDDSVLEGQRNFRIRLSQDIAGGSGMQISADAPSTDVNIDIDFDDSKK